MLLVVAAAADVDDSARVSTSSVPDKTKNGPPLYSEAVKSNSVSQPIILPPRLQRKQRQTEEENYMKYYKPMDYMRKSNSYQRKSATAGTDAMDSARQNGTGQARRVCDVNSRGNVTNRTLWTDNLASVTNGTENESSDSMVHSDHQSGTGDARLPNSTSCELKPPVTVLTSSGSKLASLEAGITSLNVHSTASTNSTSQSLHVTHVSLFYDLLRTFIFQRLDIRI